MQFNIGAARAAAQGVGSATASTRGAPACAATAAIASGVLPPCFWLLHLTSRWIPIVHVWVCRTYQQLQCLRCQHMLRVCQQLHKLPTRQ